MNWEGGLSLSEVTKRVAAMPPEHILVPGICEATSYRGYYECLGLVPSESCVASAALAILRDALGQWMEGYKGGTFKMHGGTECYIAAWGECGDPLTEEWFAHYWGGPSSAPQAPPTRKEGE